MSTEKNVALQKARDEAYPSNLTEEIAGGETVSLGRKNISLEKHREGLKIKMREESW